MRRIIDSHAHLDGLDALSAISRAKEAEVDGVIAVGGNLESSILALEMASLHPSYIFAAIGVHPADVLMVDVADAVAYIEENASRAVAVGEIGLDYAYGFAKPLEVRQRMRDLYDKLLAVAEAHSMPVAVHSRSAYSDALAGLRAHDVQGAVFHWYDGPIHTLREILDAGYYVSATPAARYSRGHMEVIRNTPPERLLVETDSPVYLRDMGRMSEPADVWLTVEAVARLKDLEPGEVARVSTRNTETLFHMPAP